MYRLLTINRVAMENCRSAVYGKKKHVGFKYYDGGGIHSFFLQPSKYQLVKNDPQKAIYCHFQQNNQYKKSAGQRQGCTQKVVTTTNDYLPHVLPLTSRLQSTTTTNAALELKRKKKRVGKPQYSKYVELLQVTNNSAVESMSRLRRINARKLENFIAKTQKEILKKKANKISGTKTKLDSNESNKKCESVTSNLAQPVKSQRMKVERIDGSLLEASCYGDTPIICHGEDKEMITKEIINNPETTEEIANSFHNFRDIFQDHNHIENDNYSVIHPSHGIEDIVDSFDSTEPYISPDCGTERQQKVAKVKEKSLPRFKSKYHQNELQERLAKARAVRVNLTTYLNVCVSVGLHNRALTTLLAYRQRAQKNGTAEHLITIDLYNILLRGFAEKTSFNRLLEIFTFIKEDKLRFNEQTFAAIFECLGRLEMTSDNNNSIQEYIKMAEDMNMSLNQIMDKSKFIGDQRDIALNAIKRVIPDFEVVYTPPILEYNNPLVNSLNENVLPCDEKGVNRNDKKEKVIGSEIMYSKLGYNKHQFEKMAEEQLKVELDGYITIKSIEKSIKMSNAEYCRIKLKEFESQWRTQISNAISRDLNSLKAQTRYKPQGYMIYQIYLQTLDASQYADIIINEIYKLAEGSETYSPTVGQLYRELGQKVQQRYHLEQQKKNGVFRKICDIYKEYCDVLGQGNSSDNTRQIWQRLIHKERTSGPSMDINQVSWPFNVLSGVGRFLYDILMRDIKIDGFVLRQNQKGQNLLPAFYTLFRNQGRHVKEEVKPHPVLAKLLRASRQQTLTFDSNFVPMLCPPQPWSTPHNGGYLLNKSELIRLPQQAIQQWDRIHSMPPQNIYPALDSLNQLASIPWRVNTDILDVIIELFQNGGDNKLNIPKPPSSLKSLPSIHEIDATISNAARAKLFKEQMSLRRKQAEMYSLWCDALYRLSLANHYRDKVFWLPHNMDFRGRVYPLPPHLNHFGSDMARSILVFDQAQPLGVNGFNWLKLHCINLTGFMKRDSIRDRLLYAEEVMPDILDSADNPLTGKKWWAQSENPWQTLACCKEIAKVSRSPNPEEYLSAVPIHQDGSCNGLQHYAALGRDRFGAESVNLSPTALPQDVYSAVASLVERMRKQDAENGLLVAQALDGFVKRKVIKQTVMTTVYGVTRYGARLQIARQLKDMDEFPKDWVWPASTYLTSKTFDSLREMFTSTREIQDWFTDCARQISGVCGKNVEWVTPLGLPVVQPYNKQELISRPKSMLRVFEVVSTDMYEKPNTLKQKNAFPPNFIHSLDSSHMMLTSLHCERNGITFVSVHDCFWTHACTVPQLNKICREQFVALHSQPILEDLSKFMKENYSFKDSDISQSNDSSEGLSKRHLNKVLSNFPEKGDFDLRNVLDSVYFFS